MEASRGPFTPSVLLVEDDAVTREQLAELLDGHVRDLDIAENGEQGLRRYEQKKYDIVVTDVLMPVMDGLEMARRIRDLDPGALIVFMSAYTEMGGSAWVRQVAAHYLPKPVDVDELVRVLGACRPEKEQRSS
jgi:CheY-like chemotaxis protein